MQLYRPRHKTARRALQALFPQFVPLSRRRYQTDTSSYNTVCDTLERITAAQHLQHIPRYKRHVKRCTGQHGRPIIIRYIKARVRPCCGSMQARRGQLLPSVNHWQVLTRCQQHRPGAPAEGSASPPDRVSPAACDLAPGQQSERTGWHPPPGGAVQQRAARNHWWLAPHLFSGFRPIANKGEQ